VRQQSSLHHKVKVAEPGLAVKGKSSAAPGGAPATYGARPGGDRGRPIRVRIGTGEAFDTTVGGVVLQRLGSQPLARAHLSEVLVSTISLERIYRRWQELSVAALNEVREELD